MKEKLLHPATVIALIALFVALSGTSYAISKLPKNSVGNKQLKKNAVTSPKVKNGSLLAEDFKAGQLPQGPQGERGLQGEPGAKGETGATGPTGPSVSGSASGSASTALSGSFSNTISLTDAGKGSGPLVLSTAGRVLAFADVSLLKLTTNSADLADVQCRIEHRQVGAGSFTSTGPTGRLTLLPTSVSGAAVGGTLSVSGAVELPAGNYDMRVACLSSSISSPSITPTIQNASLNVVVTGT